MITLFWFIVVLGVTVFIHEFGHFIFAKKNGVYVYEFSIGMGPRILKFTRKNDETVYGIRLFPIGGFVSMAGEDMESIDDVPKDKELCNKPWFARFTTIVAGVLFNFLLAFILFIIVGVINGSQGDKVYISSVEAEYPASTLLNIGDEIIALNDKKVNSYEKFTLLLSTNYGKEISFTIKSKDGIIKNVNIKPKEIKIDDGKTSYIYGISLTSDYKKGFFEAIGYAFRKIIHLVEQMFLIILYLITGKLSLNNLSGPVGIFSIVGESSKEGIISIIYLIAYLCVNVGFINLLPFPAFDGGRALFLIIEKIKGSKVNPKIENIIHTIGFILLMILMIFVTYNDIMRLLK